ncbi:hypothetical protein CPSG_05321 [Coccidioides posadasii str. Silveira]|uniref:Uncharacterized protein n=1 Tax=Coccidioides posadasii (strain RMSCC 757 / Silveira) TaxID=443226 RepID=E9D553_COCPS|nr:hypothetical protein CPSG_05321 [Coccidioides posadasii str. Silveira]
MELPCLHPQCISSTGRRSPYILHLCLIGTLLRRTNAPRIRLQQHQTVPVRCNINRFFDSNEGSNLHRNTFILSSCFDFRD